MSGIEAPGEGVMGGVEVGGLLPGIADNTTTPTDIWTGGDTVALYEGFSTDYTPQALTVQSTSASDDAADIGMRRATVEVLRSTASKSYEVVEVALDGLTGVSLGNAIRARNLTCIECGSNERNVGIVTVENAGGDRYCVVPIGENRSFECIYTVPAGLPIDIRQITSEVNRQTNSAGSGITAEIALRMREFGAGGFDPLRTFMTVGNSEFVQKFTIPVKIPPLADVVLSVTNLQNAATGGGVVSARIEFGA